MSQNGVLKKSEILQGQKKTKCIELQSLGGSVHIRPLSEGEAASIREEIMEGGKATEDGKINFDPKEGLQKIRNARNKVVAKGLSNDDNGEGWTPGEVGQLRKDAIDELADEIVHYSGLENEPTFRAWRKYDEELKRAEEEAAEELAEDTATQ